MFYVLHRLYVLSWTVLILGALAWVYPRTGISEQLVDWQAVLQNKGDASIKPVAEISGTVLKVTDGASLMLRADDRQLYSVALLGLVAPAYNPRTVEADLARRSKARLSELVLSNRVEVTLTWLDPYRRGVGVVRLGSTNVNAAMVESGLVHFKRNLIKGLPLLDQFALVRAERKAREARAEIQTAAAE